MLRSRAGTCVAGTLAPMTYHGFERIDLVAVGFFALAWLAHTWVLTRSPWRTRTISHRMAAFRQQWMMQMVRRELRMVDALIQNSLLQGVLFFASTSILLIGGLLAGLGSGDAAIRVLEDIRFSTTDTRTEWEFKVLLVVVIFMYAFFKFAWSYRLFNYVIIMIGAAPDYDGEDATLDAYAGKVAQLHVIAARHFTMGLSSYFFALGAVAWFLNAWAFMVATVWVSLVLYRRTFHSNFMKVLSL